MKKYLYLLVLSFLISLPSLCQVQKSEADTIRHYLREGRVDGLLDLFKKNISLRDQFPENNEDLKLLFEYVNRHKLIKRKKSYLIIFKIKFYNRNNVEFQEYYHEVIPYLAINDITLFVKALGSLNIDEQIKILENLEYLPDIKTINIIRCKIDSLESPQNKAIILRIHKAINKIFE